MAKNSLSHVDKHGRARMVNVGGKRPTRRSARAEAFVRLEPRVLEAVMKEKSPKGPVLETARLAGIAGAKKTSDLIPLCHPLGLDHADVDFEVRDDGIRILARAELTARTGVEMEAMTAAAVAALTIYDMTKALSKKTSIEGIRLLEKTGGKSGRWKRSSGSTGSRESGP